jgi:hypothetical protein
MGNTKHMNAEIIIREMELAAYEMAEAETCEARKEN